MSKVAHLLTIKIQLQSSSIPSAAVSLPTSEQQNIPQQNWPTQYPQYYDPNQAYYNAVPMQDYHQIQQYYPAMNQEQAIPQQIAYSNEPVQLPEHPGAQQQPRSETPSDDSWVKPEIEQDNQPKVFIRNSLIDTRDLSTPSILTRNKKISC